LHGRHARPAKRLDEIKPLNPLILENREYTPDEIKQIPDHDGEIVFRRQQFEKLADNAHLSAILRLVLRPYQDIVMYGVYTEACVAREIAALIGGRPETAHHQRRGRDRRTESSTFHEKLLQQGVELLTFAELKIRILN